MVIREVAANEYLVVDQKILAEAGLTGRLRLVVQPGEIRILPEAEPDLEKTLDELMGCLGQEPAEEYDFNLEIGGWYEAR